MISNAVDEIKKERKEAALKKISSNLVNQCHFWCGKAGKEENKELNDISKNLVNTAISRAKNQVKAQREKALQDASSNIVNMTSKCAGKSLKRRERKRTRSS